MTTRRRGNFLLSPLNRKQHCTEQLAVIGWEQRAAWAHLRPPRADPSGRCWTAGGQCWGRAARPPCPPASGWIRQSVISWCSGHEFRDIKLVGAHEVPAVCMKPSSAGFICALNQRVILCHRVNSRVTNLLHNTARLLHKPGEPTFSSLSSSSVKNHMPCKSDEEIVS